MRPRVGDRRKGTLTEEVTPTILKLIRIGIAHLDTTEDVGDRASIDEIRNAIALINSRLTEVENKLSKASIEQTKSYKVEEQPAKYDSSEEKILSDIELSDVLGVSNILIRDYRLYGKKPRGAFLAKALTEHWEIKGEGWVRKD